MPHLFDSISKIHPPREAQRLKVRSNKIQATVKKQLINRFKDSIIEGQTYQMSYFSVVPNQGNYRAVEHEFKLVFLNRTTVIPVLDDAIPKTCFSFYPFDELLKMTEDYVYLVDIIGFLTYVGEEKGYVKHAKVMKMIVLELSSKELTIRCALFGEYVDEVHRFLGDFMWLTRRCTIEELHDNNEEGSFVVFGIVRSIVDERPWWYSHYVTNVTSRYRIKIAVEDDNGHAVFVLFDREAAYLLEKFKRMQVVCGDSYPVMFQQLVCDDAAIISMFELANHDADDERTPLKNGYLGKIPSSEDEYIIDKKDLCEVLDEVPGLDDIITEVDIVKEVGKSVDDSVLLNRECSLEIEGLLNSPLVKTTAVLFAILDRFPVNVIKKETVSNPLRGREVKKNLKKVLMMLPMRSFAQLPRFSRTVIFEMF
ncbi:Replication factor-A carboxy-terminal domain protein [Arachis hypogaea]|nr:Replication factor-A carboxy-terminal domain protein [Arachis hypogaea]